MSKWIASVTIAIAATMAAMTTALDEGDSTGVGCGTFQPRLLDQKARDDPMDDLQHRREQLGMGG